MAFEFVTMEEIEKTIEDEEDFHEGLIGVLEAMKQALYDEGTLFHDRETDKWFLVPKGQPIPIHLESLILGR